MSRKLWSVLSDQSPDERTRWIELTKGLPFSHLSEVVISVKCMGNDLEETIQRLRKMDEHAPSSSEFNLLQLDDAERPATN